MSHFLYTDGGARGNPGPAAGGVVLMDNDKIVHEAGIYLGETTNNIAEYKALIYGLQAAIEKKLNVLECFLDSELIVKQINGLYKVKHENLIPLFEQVQKLKADFKSIKFTHVPREKNKHADKLVNKVLDSLPRK